MALSMVGVSLTCSRCGHLLFEAEITIDLDNKKGTNAKDILVTTADFICPECKFVLRHAQDDLTRKLNEYMRVNKDEIK